ncbi:MAG: hypothetical protein DRK00_06265 [Thermoprotei archaeon]|nr:MAG: hypothetical protein DRK00_06265 [Thermoprotei archaeon]
MYVRMYFENRGEMVAWISEDLNLELPFQSEVRRWKQEVYFEAPLKVEGEGTLVVDRGDVAFWPPGGCLCLFHGVSQPYSPVIKLGAIVGVPDLLTSVEDGTPVRIDSYKDYGEEGKIAELLRKRGFKAVSHTWEEEEYVGVLVEGANSRVGMEVSVEDYGFYVQTQPIAFFDNSPPTISFYRSLSPEISATGVRLDLDEEGYMVLTSFFNTVDELVKGLKRMLSTYVYVERMLTAFYAVRRP